MTAILKMFREILKFAICFDFLRLFKKYCISDLTNWHLFLKCIYCLYSDSSLDLLKLHKTVSLKYHVKNHTRDPRLSSLFHTYFLDRCYAIYNSYQFTFEKQPCLIDRNTIRNIISVCFKQLKIEYLFTIVF